MTLKKNKTSAISATVKKAGKGKLHKSSKIPQIRYFSSNKKVATVNGKGVIKAVRKGKCKIKRLYSQAFKQSVQVRNGNHRHS